MADVLKKVPVREQMRRYARQILMKYASVIIKKKPWKRRQDA